MATRAPSDAPMVDQLSVISFTDPEPASILILKHADATLHALTTEWGYPPHVQGLSMPTSAADRVLLVPLPPSVKYVNVGILASGRGTVTVTDTTTSDTTTIYWGSSATEASDKIELASWSWTTGIMDDSVAHTKSPALKLASSAVWYPRNYQPVTLNPTAVGSGGGTIWAVAIAPIWEDQAVT